MIIKAQAPVPNGGFESWTGFGLYEMPDAWKTTDSLSMSVGTPSATKETTDMHGGLYALKLTPFFFVFTNIPGAASNGVINTTTFQIIGGSPDTVRHAKLSGWYKYAPVSGDSCTISVTMYKRNGATRDVIGSGIFGTSAATSAYTPFDVNMNYSSINTPDSVLISIFSSAMGSAHLGTTLLIDDLAFSGFVGIHEIPGVVNSLNTFPNPAQNELNVSVDLQKNIRTRFEISDLNGRKVSSFEMKSLNEKFDVSFLVSGNYFYRLADENGNTLGSGKFSISK